MNTRGKSAKGGPAAPTPEDNVPPTRRSARGGARKAETPAQADGNEAAGAAKKMRASKPSASAGAAQSNYKLMEDPVPRKGAPRRQAGSLASLASRSSPHRSADDDDSEENQDSDENQEIQEAGEKEKVPENETDKDGEAEAGNEGEKENGEEQAKGKEQEMQEMQEMPPGAEQVPENERLQYRKRQHVFLLSNPETTNEVPAGSAIEYAQNTDIQLEFMRLLIGDLARSAQTLIVNYALFDKNERLAQKISRLNIGKLDSVRREFIPENISMIGGNVNLLELALIERLPQISREEASHFQTIFVLVNLATLFEIIYLGAERNLGESGRPNLEALQLLDRNFQLFFGSNLITEDTPSKLNLALGIRGMHLIAALHSRPELSIQEALMMALSVFCANETPTTQEELDEAINHGPFKLIAGQGNEIVHTRCYIALRDIVLHINDDNKGRAKKRTSVPEKEQPRLFTGLQHIKKRHAAKTLLGFVKDVYAEIEPRVVYALQALGNDHFHDAQTELSDDKSYGDESQPIERATESQAKPFLFHGPTDLRLLADSQSPMSQPQSVMGGRTFPVNRQAKPLASPMSRQRRKRTRVQEVQAVAGEGSQSVDKGKDEEEDTFQTDARALDEQAREAKRQRLGGETDQYVFVPQQQQQQQPSSSSTAVVTVAPTANMQQGTQRPAPQPIDLGELENRRRESASLAAAAARRERIALQDSGPRQRSEWSEHDSRVLLECVEKHLGKWSKIEADEQSRFEYPRNQQAYRDRARNMKVHFLMTDMPLPRCFDYVALAKKERDRVIAVGKNPDRRESDIDSLTGQLTNTVYQGPQ